MLYMTCKGYDNDGGVKFNEIIDDAKDIAWYATQFDNFSVLMDVTRYAARDEGVAFEYEVCVRDGDEKIMLSRSSGFNADMILN